MAFLTVICAGELLWCTRVAEGGVIAVFTMEEGMETATGDASGNGNNADFISEPAWISGCDANSNFALYFSGDDYLTVPDSVSLDSISGGLSVTFWLNADGSTTHDTVVWKPGAFYIRKYNSSIRVDLQGVPNVTDREILAGFVPDGEWTHIAVTYDGRYLAGYVAGLLRSRIRVNDGYVSISTSNSPLYIGWHNSNPYYQGSLDNLRIYNHSLSSPEVNADMLDRSAWTSQTLSIVQGGLPISAIVIPTSGILDVEQYAAEELQYHIRKATGATLSIYGEDSVPGGYSGLIYIGACKATANAGINGSYLSDNAYALRSFGPNLHLAGNDSSGDVLGMLHINQTRIGTMLSVYEFLEKYLDVKWLWPGESGEIIPSRSDISADNLNIIGKPYLAKTRLRDNAPYAWGHNNSCEGWTSEASRDRYLNDQSVWLRRQRFCISPNLGLEYGHSFTGYWSRFGTTHPEYFNLLPDGTRRPDPLFYNGEPTLVSMCMAEPNLVDQVIADWVSNGAIGWINCTKNDTSTKDVDSRSMAWDVEPGDFEIQYGCPWSERLSYASSAFLAEEPNWYTYLGPMSDRYAKFLLAVQQEAAASGYPEVTVVGYAYANRTKAPISTVLNDRIIIGIVPGISLPWSEKDQGVFRSLWSGWTETAGTRAFLRPNFLQEGHNMPIFFAERFGEDFVYALRRGMVSADFDSLTGQWGTQGPNLYMLARALHHVEPVWPACGTDTNHDAEVNFSDLAALLEHWLENWPNGNPLANCVDFNGNGKIDIGDFAQLAAVWKSGPEEVDTILSEFYSAFGPAEEEIRAYFEHWAQVSDDANDPGVGWESWFEVGPSIFPPGVLADGRTLLDAATIAAQGSVQAEKLVSFLEKGLTNAELTVDAQLAWEDYTSTGELEGWQSAIAQLDDYRTAVESNGISNMAFLRYAENRIWKRTVPSAVVTGGTIYSLFADRLQDQIVNNERLIVIHNDNADDTAYVMLDIGTPALVGRLAVRNTAYSASNYMGKDVAVWVAADESDPNFEPLEHNSYSYEVYQGQLLPLDNTAGTVRYADINNISRRYFLIGFKSNFWDVLPVQTYVWAGDFYSE